MAETIAINGIETLAENKEYVVLAASLAKLSAEVVSLIKEIQEEEENIEQLEKIDYTELDLPDGCQNIDNFEDADSISKCADNLLFCVRKTKLEKLEEFA